MFAFVKKAVIVVFVTIYVQTLILLQLVMELQMQPLLLHLQAVCVHQIMWKLLVLQEIVKVQTMPLLIKFVGIILVLAMVLQLLLHQCVVSTRYPSLKFKN